MTYRFLPEARAEFDTAADWFDAQQPPRGDEFIDEVYATVQKIVAQPQAYPLANRVPAGREVRVALVDRFDYLVFYEVTPTEVIILSVAHAKRGRQTWRGRL